MLTILIVDDEKLERRGIRFLLEREHGNEEFHILEAANGRAACDLLKRQDVDLLFTDIKMPFMDGLELAAHARELRPQIETVIFSGYGEFEYARQAMRSGVEYYVLKPVDPREFAATLKAVLEKIRDRKQQEQKQQASQDFLNEYFLGKYLYQGTPDLLRRISGRIDITGWERIQGLILIEGEDCFFEDSEETFIRELSGEIQQKLMFLNLGQNQELCVLCSSCDLPVLAEHICRWINARFGSRFYVAAGRQVERPQELTAAFRELEVLMENKFTKGLYLLFVLSMVVPFQMVMFTLSQTADRLNLNTPWNIWIIYLGFGAGLAVFMFCGFMKSIPVEIEEASLIDGCNPIQTFFLVVIPMMKPTMISVGILEAMWLWNDYLLPTLVLDIKKYMTIPMLIQYFRGSYGKVEMGPMMACIILTIIPIIVVYLIGQKHIIKGVAAGAVKG